MSVWFLFYAISRHGIKPVFTVKYARWC